MALGQREVIDTVPLVRKISPARREILNFIYFPHPHPALEWHTKLEEYLADQAEPATLEELKESLQKIQQHLWSISKCLLLQPLGEREDLATQTHSVVYRVVCKLPKRWGDHLEDIGEITFQLTEAIPKLQEKLPTFSLPSNYEEDKWYTYSGSASNEPNQAIIAEQNQRYAGQTKSR